MAHMTQNNFEITESAANRIAYLFEQDKKPELYFRITVLGGGCSGFQYKYDFDDKITDKDIIIEKNKARVAIDDISIGFLTDSKIDYVEDLGSAGFEIKNPNATAKCGCGNSFSI
jgi:iron-sulfur cluster insertion protein